MRLFLLLAPVLALPPNALQTYTGYATTLRAALLANYDKAVAPTSIRTVSYSQAGTDVHLQMRFFKVREVSANEGRMSLKVWLRMWWNDTRLSWEPKLYGNITTVKFSAASYAMPGDSEIWLPGVCTALAAALGGLSCFDVAAFSSPPIILFSQSGHSNIHSIRAFDCRFHAIQRSGRYAEHL